MTLTSLIIPRTTTKHSTIPRWKSLLYARGITDRAITRAGIQPHGHTWNYPIDPNLSARREKAFPGQTGPKYLWQPGKPDAARFYDPAGDLAQHIAQANGVLILASGEVDVWSCWSAGLYNVTCTLHGEGTIPAWFVEQVHALNVLTVQLWPDCDTAGMKHAAKVTAIAVAASITCEVYALPFAEGSKGDLNTLLIEVGASDFRAALESCPAAELPAPEVVTSGNPPRQIKVTRYEFDPYERWCLEVEAVAVQVWAIHPANGKNLSARNFLSPRGEHDPSAQWNYSTHGFKDYGDGGRFVNTKECAELLGLPAYERAVITRQNGNLQNISTNGRNLPDLLTIIPHTIGRRLIEAGLHNAVLVLSRHGVQGDLSRRTRDNGVKELRDVIGINVRFETHTCKASIYAFQNVQQIPQRGHPHGILVLPSPAEVLDRLEEFFEGRARNVRYQDTPINVQPDFAAPVLDGDACHALDTARAGVYDDHDHERQHASVQVAHDLDILHADFERIRAGRFNAFDLPDGVTSAAELRRALYVRKLDENPDGVESYKIRRTAGVSRATQSRLRQEYETITIPQHVDRLVSSCDDITLGPKQTAELIAPDGSTLFLVGRDAGEQAQDFLAEHPGSTLRTGKPSIEKRREHANPAEVFAYTAYSEKQRARAGGADHTDQHHTRDRLTPAGYSVKWLLKQLNYTPGAETVARYDAETGEVYTPGQLWQHLAEQLHEGETMPTFAVYCEPKEGDYEQEPTTDAENHAPAAREYEHETREILLSDTASPRDDSTGARIDRTRVRQPDGNRNGLSGNSPRRKLAIPQVPGPAHRDRDHGTTSRTAEMVASAFPAGQIIRVDLKKFSERYEDTDCYEVAAR